MDRTVALPSVLSACLLVLACSTPLTPPDSSLLIEGPSVAPAKGTPPPEYLGAPPAERLGRIWRQRIGNVDPSYEYKNNEWLRPAPFGPEFTGWSSTFVCWEATYEVEVARTYESFKGVPNFRSQKAPMCAAGRECQVQHRATQIQNDVLIVIPGGKYKWQGRLVLNRYILNFQNGNFVGCGALASSGPLGWESPQVPSADGSFSDRSLFGVQQEWYSRTAVAKDVFLLGGVQLQSDWQTRTGFPDGVTVTIEASERGKPFTVGAPLSIPNLNYAREGRLRVVGTADSTCEHVLSIRRTSYNTNDVLEEYVIDRRRLVSGQPFRIEFPIVRSGHDLRYWLIQTEEPMSGHLLVVASCNSAVTQARVQYDLFDLAYEALPFVRQHW